MTNFLERIYECKHTKTIRAVGIIPCFHSSGLCFHSSGPENMERYHKNLLARIRIEL